MRSFLQKLRWLTSLRSREAELQDELRFHLEEEAEERQADGISPEQAARAARRELGNLTLTAEDTRAAWGWTILEQFAQDLRYAFRTMSANRVFSALAVLSLALGIGANTAIFSFMDAILLRSLPVPDPQSLVVLTWKARPANHDFVMRSISGSTYDDHGGVTAGIFPYPAFELFRRYDAIFSTVFANFPSWQVRRANLTVHGQAAIGSGCHVSGDYFRGLGIVPAAGRLIAPDDDRPGAPAVAVVSYRFSQARFGDAASAAGQQLLIDNLPFNVIGVAPPEFFGVDPASAPDVYLPLHSSEQIGAFRPFGFKPDAYLDRNYYWTQILGRLRPGVTLAQAQAVLAPVFQQWVESTANDQEKANLPQLVVKPGAGGLESLRREYSQPLYMLGALVILILALACANVANLLLARAAARRREVALRLSVGAGRLRIVRQLLTESLLLASMGGALGVLFALWGIRFLTLLLANGSSGFTVHAELNWHVLAAAAVLSLLTGVLFGLAPALAATRVDVMPALKGMRAALAPSRHGFRRLSLRPLLLTAQIAISLLLLVAAGLFVRTLVNLHSIELGFNRENVLLFQLDARKAGHQDGEIAAFYAGLRRRFAALPAVSSVSLSEDSLIQAGTGLPIGVAGKPPDENNRLLSVGPAFFTTMQIPILAGREFDERDQPGSPAVAVVNEVFAKTNFGDRNPLGQHLILRKSGGTAALARDMEIVGVTRNARYGGLTEKIPPVIYLPYNQGYPQPDQMVFALRTTGDPLRQVNSVREIVRAADARVPVSEIRTQAADIDSTINQEITFAELCSGLALLALLIACVGLYGSVSYNVASRTSEIGIRMALGARQAGVVRMVLREVVTLAAAGLAIGLTTAHFTSRFVAAFLYGIEADDSVAFTVAAVTLLSAAVLAAWLPARKASRIDPMAALRQD